MNKSYHSDYNLKRYHQRKQEYINLLGGKCVHCGSIDDLQFDHIDASKKSFTIGMRMTYPRHVVIEELKKCQLLCRFCHNKKTAKCKDGYERKPNGERINHSKLTGDQVKEIRLISNMTHQKIAEMYGVTRSTVSQIIRKQIWKHIL